MEKKTVDRERKFVKERKRAGSGLGIALKEWVEMKVRWKRRSVGRIVEPTKVQCLFKCRMFFIQVLLTAVLLTGGSVNGCTIKVGVPLPTVKAMLPFSHVLSKDFQPREELVNRN